jgi:hypothetical protein
MRIHFQDHPGFQRGALHVAVACSAVACAAGVIGSDRFPAAVAVLAAAVATLALALGHLRLVIDPAAHAVARAQLEVDAAGRGLLARALAARATIARTVGGEGALPGAEGRALVAAATQATAALADVSRRRYRLAERLRAAAPPAAATELEALERRASSCGDGAAREAYGRAARALRERTERAAAFETVIERIDARLQVAVAELEGTALAVGTRAELAPGEPPAALASACDRLRAANAELGAECEALAEIG